MEVQTPTAKVLEAYLGEYLVSKTIYKRLGETTKVFREYTIFFMEIMLVQLNPYFMPKNKACPIVAE